MMQWYAIFINIRGCNACSTHYKPVFINIKIKLEARMRKNLEAVDLVSELFEVSKPLKTVNIIFSLQT
jgi:hypothetical protein